MNFFTWKPVSCVTHRFDKFFGLKDSQKLLFCGQHYVKYFAVIIVFLLQVPFIYNHVTLNQKEQFLSHLILINVDVERLGWMAKLENFLIPFTPASPQKTSPAYNLSRYPCLFIHIREEGVGLVSVKKDK